MRNYKEASFPVTYREPQVRQIMDAVKRLRSIAVLGLAGMGKSNLFRFLVAHPRVREHYLGDSAARFVFVLVDCNLIDSRSQDAILEEFDEQLERAGLSLPDAPISAHPLSLRRQIQRRLEHLESGRVVVVLLDPLDEAFRSLDASFWAFLRALRDLQGGVVYVLGARHPPSSLTELQELFTSACWLTPLSRADALASLARDGARLAHEFSPRAAAQLLELAAGHPGLLKNAAECVARGQVPLEGAPQALASRLLAHEPVRRVCADLISDLTPGQFQILQWIALDAGAVAGSVPAVDFLKQTGLIRPVREAHFEISSPVLAEFVRAQTRRIVRVTVGAFPYIRLQSWQGEATLELSETAHELLRALSRSPEETHSFTQLARHLYSGDPHYSRQALEAHVKRLRRALNGALETLMRDKEFNSILSQRNRGYRLNLVSPRGWQIEYQSSS